MSEQERPQTYKASWICRLFFWYLNDSMKLSNKLCGEGKCLTRTRTTC